MGLIDTIGRRRTYIDANVFIYAVEGYERFERPLGAFFGAVARRAAVAVTSELALAEVLVKPFREARPDIRTSAWSAFGSVMRLSQRAASVSRHWAVHSLAR